MIISNILIQRTEELERERKEALDKAYNDFIIQIDSLKNIDNNLKNKKKQTLSPRRNIQFLQIDVSDQEYTYDSQYIISLNTDPKVNKYGISCSDVVNRINELMNTYSQPYKCSYSIHWYSGKGINGCLNRLQRKSPYVKSINFVLNTVSFCCSDSSGSQ